MMGRRHGSLDASARSRLPKQTHAYVWTLGQASGAAERGFKEKKGNNANVRDEETDRGGGKHKSSCMIGMTEAEPRNR